MKNNGLAVQTVDKVIFSSFGMSLRKFAIVKSSVIPVLVTGIQPAQVLELKESFDPTDVGSLDPRHKGEDDGELGADLARSSFQSLSAV
ncbi:hypothetical protein [Pararhizobium sp.]|uniref:hypothetical protein n=1 Tax=Pararhizobium sp. TaxID=1977563 RepID=UPI003D0CB12D